MGDPERVSAAEIAALAARLRSLSQAGRAADDAERERFIADKERLLARIEAQTDTRVRSSSGPGSDGPRRGGRQWADGPGAPSGADRPGQWPARDDSGGWYSGGLDAAHQADLDARAHVDAEPDADLDGAVGPYYGPGGISRDRDPDLDGDGDGWGAS